LVPVDSATPYKAKLDFRVAVNIDEAITESSDREVFESIDNEYPLPLVAKFNVADPRLPEDEYPEFCIFSDPYDSLPMRENWRMNYVGRNVVSCDVCRYLDIWIRRYNKGDIGSSDIVYNNGIFSATAYQLSGLLHGEHISADVSSLH
jgi:hypothetical protein